MKFYLKNGSVLNIDIEQVGTMYVHYDGTISAKIFDGFCAPSYLDGITKVEV